MRFLLTILAIWSVAISLSSFPTDISLASAFINDEIASQPGINSTEICGNNVDDDGDGLIDNQDTKDCFPSPPPQTSVPNYVFADADKFLLLVNSGTYMIGLP